MRQSSLRSATEAVSLCRPPAPSEAAGGSEEAAAAHPAAKERGGEDRRPPNHHLTPIDTVYICRLFSLSNWCCFLMFLCTVSLSAKKGAFKLI